MEFLGVGTFDSHTVKTIRHRAHRKKNHNNLHVEPVVRQYNRRRSMCGYYLCMREQTIKQQALQKSTEFFRTAMIE